MAYQGQMNNNKTNNSMFFLSCVLGEGCLYNSVYFIMIKKKATYMLSEIQEKELFQIGLGIMILRTREREESQMIHAITN